MNWCCTPSIGLESDWISLNVSTVKLRSKFYFQCFWGFFDAILLWPLIKSTFLSICWFGTLVFAWVWPLKLELRNSKFTKEQEKFANWAIDGAQHQFSKNWWSRHKSGVPFSWICRTQNISKNKNLYPHQSKINLPGLLWDTLSSNPVSNV